jgi:hypothetical protein
MLYPKPDTFSIVAVIKTIHRGPEPGANLIDDVTEAEGVPLVSDVQHLSREYGVI